MGRRKSESGRMIANVIMLILISFSLLLFTGAGMFVSVVMFIGFRRNIRFLYSEYVWVIFGLAWIGMMVALFLEASLDLGIIDSTRIDHSVVATALPISLYTTGISFAVGATILYGRRLPPSRDKP